MKYLAIQREYYFQKYNKGCIASVFQLEDGASDKININAVMLDGKFDHIEADGLIGNNFLQKYVVLIDFLGKKFFIKPNSHKDVTNDPVHVLAWPSR